MGEPKSKPSDPEQRRISLWANYIFRKHGYRTQQDMADEMADEGKPGNQGHLSAILNNRDRTAGLDFVMRLATAGKESMDAICFREPPDYRGEPIPPTLVLNRRPLGERSRPADAARSPRPGRREAPQGPPPDGPGHPRRPR